MTFVSIGEKEVVSIPCVPLANRCVEESSTVHIKAYIGMDIALVALKLCIKQWRTLEKKHGVNIEPDLTRCTIVVVSKLYSARDAALTTISSVIENYKNELVKQEAVDTTKENFIAELEYAQSVMKKNGKKSYSTQSNRVDVVENVPTI